jgi:hypothetical protein
MAEQQQRKEAGQMNDIDTDEAYRNQVKTNYEFSIWAGRTRAGGPDVHLTDVRIGPEEVKGWELEESEDLPGPKQQRALRYIYSSSENSKRRLVLTTTECNSVLEAHESLIDVVMTYMAPRLPRCEARGLELGDICFGSHGEVNLSAIFARFNILAEIKNAGTEATPVDEFARAVDAAIFGRYRRTTG